MGLHCGHTPLKIASARRNILTVPGLCAQRVVSIKVATSAAARKLHPGRLFTSMKRSELKKLKGALKLNDAGDRQREREKEIRPPSEAAGLLNGKPL